MTVVADLGCLAGPLLVGGGAYGNLEALEAFARLADDLAVEPGNVIHTGDVAAYCADPEGSIDLIATRGWRAIKGNIEAQLARRAGDCDCGFAPGSSCDALAARWYAHADRAVGGEARRWLATLPDNLRFTLAGRSFLVVHGSPSRANRFMFASRPEAEFLSEIDLAESDAVIAGHTGIPFTRTFGERLWANAGAIGLPANDGTPRAWALLIEPRGAAIAFRHLAFSYDHRNAARRMRAAGLPQGYALALETGLWPSLDVLPEVERDATGVPLSPMHALWEPALRVAAE
jgi:predicted phosphodiesterase